MSDRIYTEKEIRGILKQASAMQQEEGAGDASGLSLSELKQVAEEVGIDPQHVEAAALRLEERSHRSVDAETLFLGAPTTISMGRIVEGEVTEDDWEHIVPEIRKAFGAVGTPGRLGRSYEWVHRGVRNEQIQVTLTPEDGHTRLRVYWQYGRSAKRLHFPLMVLGVMLAVTTFSGTGLGPQELALMLVLLAGLHLVARFSFRAVAGRKDQTVRRLMDTLEHGIIERGERTVQPAGETAERLLDLSDLDTIPEKPEAQAMPRRRRSRR